MDFYNAILYLYSPNVQDVLNIINTAIHSEHNLDLDNEAIHTGFYCLNHNGKRFGFLYSLTSQSLYYQIDTIMSYPLGTLFHNVYEPTAIGAYQNSKMQLKPNIQNNYKFVCYQGFDALNNSFFNKTLIAYPICYPIPNYQYFIFKKFEGFHYIEVKVPRELQFKQLYSKGFALI